MVTSIKQKCSPKSHKFFISLRGYKYFIGKLYKKILIRKIFFPLTQLENFRNKQLYLILFYQGGHRKASYLGE